MNESDTPPTRILELVGKLVRLLNDPAASEGEKQAAQSRIDSILIRYRITLKEVTGNERLERTFHCDYEHEKTLLFQVVGMILNQTKIRHKSYQRWLEPKVKRANPGIKGYVIWMNLTADEWIDICECFNHYSGMLDVEMDKARQIQRDLLKRARNVMKDTPCAFIQKFKIHPENGSDEAARKLSKAELERLIHIMQMAAQIEGEQWQKRGKLGTGTQELAYS